MKSKRGLPLIAQLLRVAATQRLLLMSARAVVDTEAGNTCYVIADQKFARLTKWLSVRRCQGQQNFWKAVCESISP